MEQDDQDRNGCPAGPRMSFQEIIESAKEHGISSFHRTYRCDIGSLWHLLGAWDTDSRGVAFFECGGPHVIVISFPRLHVACFDLYESIEHARDVDPNFRLLQDHQPIVLAFRMRKDHTPDEE